NGSRRSRTTGTASWSIRPSSPLRSRGPAPPRTVPPTMATAAPPCAASTPCESTPETELLSPRDRRRSRGPTELRRSLRAENPSDLTDEDLSLVLPRILPAEDLGVVLVHLVPFRIQDCAHRVSQLRGIDRVVHLAAARGLSDAAQLGQICGYEREPGSRVLEGLVRERVLVVARDRLVGDHTHVRRSCVRGKVSRFHCRQEVHPVTDA